MGTEGLRSSYLNGWRNPSFLALIFVRDDRTGVLSGSAISHWPESAQSASRVNHMLAEADFILST